MGREIEGILRHRDATPEEIRQAIALGVREAVREHKAAGRSIVVWDRENDRTVEIPADQIEIPGEADALTTSHANDAPG